MKYLLFTGPSCKACGPMKRNLAAAGIIYEEHNIEIKENAGIASAYQVKALPTLVVVDKGQPRDSFPGALPIGELKRIYGRYGA